MIDLDPIRFAHALKRKLPTEADILFLVTIDRDY